MNEGRLVFACFTVEHRVGWRQVHDAMIPLQNLAELVPRYDEPIMTQFVHWARPIPKPTNITSAWLLHRRVGLLAALLQMSRGRVTPSVLLAKDKASNEAVGIAQGHGLSAARAVQIHDGRCVRVSCSLLQVFRTGDFPVAAEKTSVRVRRLLSDIDIGNNAESTQEHLFRGSVFLDQTKVMEKC